MRYIKAMIKEGRLGGMAQKLFLDLELLTGLAIVCLLLKPPFYLFMLLFLLVPALSYALVSFGVVRLKHHDRFDMLIIFANISIFLAIAIVTGIRWYYV